MRFQIVRAGAPADCHVFDGNSVEDAINQFADGYEMQFRMLSRLAQGAKFEMGDNVRGWFHYYVVVMSRPNQPQALKTKLPRRSMGWLYDMMWAR